MTSTRYANPALPVQDRVRDLLSRMDLDEKLAQLGAVPFAELIVDGRLDEAAARRAMPHGTGQVTRIGATTGLRPAESAEVTNQVQRLAVEGTRLGIPVIVHEESVAGYCARDATVFPQALGLAATWDPGLVEEIAAAVRDQLTAVGARQGLAPVLDIARDPRWGRVEETYGEDPVLAGALGAAYVRGLQSNDLRGGVLATGKHFLAHAMPEGGRNHGPVQVGPRELREVYAEPFAAAIRDAGLACVMSTYSCIDGLPGSGSAQVLTTLLRRELGFDGLVVADYFAVALLATYHRVAADRQEAATKALAAGLDLELPALDCYGGPLKKAVSSGQVPMGLIDQAVGRVLAAKVRLGLFESPYVDASSAPAHFGTPALAGLARRAAARSLVLLANDGVLPLAPGLSSVAVIGPAADDRRLLQGDYHYPSHQENLYLVGTPGEEGASPSNGNDAALAYLPASKGAFSPGEHYTHHVTPLQGLRSALAPSVRVSYQMGCEVQGDDASGIGAAVKCAREADVAIVVVGGRSGLHRRSTVGEARDAVELRLTGQQERLVAEVVATGTPTVVVVMSGRVHVLQGPCQDASALLVCAPLGEQGGAALADVLTGAAEPVGRLPVTLPRAGGQVPVYHSHRSGGSRSMFYGDYTDCDHRPLYCFGHGLGYGQFAFSGLEVEATTTTAALKATVRVANVGPRASETVVQLYASDLVATVARPERALIGFARVALGPGGTALVEFQVHPSRLAFYDEAMRFVTEPGAFRFAAGSSSADLPVQAEVELSGPVAAYSQRSVVPVRSEVRAV